MIVKVMTTLKTYGWSTWYRLDKTNVAKILPRLIIIILINTFFMQAWRTIDLSLDALTRMVAFKYSIACELCLKSTLFFFADVLQCERLFRINIVDLRIAISAMFRLLEFRVLFTIIAEMIRWGFAAPTLFCLAWTFLANKSIINIMLFLFS